MVLELVLGAIVVIAVLAVIGASLYRVVPADVADVVIQGNDIRVYSSHPEYNKEGKAAYFKIPSWFFLFNKGMKVITIPLAIIPIDVPDFLAFDKERARFKVDIITYVAVRDPIVTAKRFNGDLEQLGKQISFVIQSTMRDATTKKSVREIINDRKGMITEITPQLKEVIEAWGLDLVSVELIDFKDDPDEGSRVIADISSMIETQITSEARQKNADNLKLARLKEAEAEELAKQREIAKDQAIAMRLQKQAEEVAVSQKAAVEKQLEVSRTQQTTNAEIEKARIIIQTNQEKEVAVIQAQKAKEVAEVEKERAIIAAEQLKEVESRNKEKKILEGEGDRFRAESQARGNAAAIRENGLAEAEAKEKLQDALNKFTKPAIEALVAQAVVEKDKAIGIEAAKALQQAEIKEFTGGGAGMDIAKLVEALKVGSPDGANAILNRIARPNEIIGNGSLDVKVEKKQTQQRGENG